MPTARRCLARPYHLGAGVAARSGRGAAPGCCAPSSGRQRARRPVPRRRARSALSASRDRRSRAPRGAAAAGAAAMIIGTAGHIDHGKTSLVRALTGVDTDRLKEEKARGISIDLGFAYLPAPDGSVLGFVDVPGHERFVHNMLAGATGIDFVLLVVAADDGDHAADARASGDRRPARHRARRRRPDQGRSGRRDAARGGRGRDHASCWRRRALAGAEIVPVSAVTGEGIDWLARRASSRPQRARSARAAGGPVPPGGRSLLHAARRRHGGDRNGAVGRGRGRRSRRGQPVRAARRACARSTRRTGRPNAAWPGERCALNLAGEGISKDAIARGDMVLDPELHAPTDRIDADLAAARDRAQAGRPMDAGAAASCSGGGRRPRRAARRRADRARRRSLCAAGAGAADRGRGRRSLRDARHHGAAHHRRRHVSRSARAGPQAPHAGAAARSSTPMRSRSPETRWRRCSSCAAALRRSHGLRPRPGARAERRSRRLPIDSAIVQIAAPAQRHRACRAAAWLRPSSAASLADLEAFHAENPDLPGHRPRAPAAAARAAAAGAGFLLAMLQAWRGRTRSRSTAPGCGCPVTWSGSTPQDEAALGEIEPLLAGAERFRPPRVRDIAGLLHAGAGSPPAAEAARPHGQGRRGRARSFLPARHGGRDGGDHRRPRRDSAEGASSPPRSFRDRLDNGRKVAIQILEFFDRHGVTLRRGDLRRINKHRLDLFRRRPAEPSADERHLEENRPRWGVRTSNPGGAASRSLVGSTPTLFRQSPGAPR